MIRAHSKLKIHWRRIAGGRAECPEAQVEAGRYWRPSWVLHIEADKEIPGESRAWMDGWVDGWIVVES